MSFSRLSSCTQETRSTAALVFSFFVIDNNLTADQHTPKLFTLYINHLCEVLKILKSALFADDANIFCSGENLQQLGDGHIRNEKKIWSDSNKL